MTFWHKVAQARRQKHFRDKLAEMLTEFCLEAAVLISVLGVLDTAISLGKVPGAKVFTLSLGTGLVFFLVACIIQVNESAKRADDNGTEGESDNVLGNS